MLVLNVFAVPWFRELHERLLEVAERPLHQTIVLLVMVQQVVPQRLLR